MVSDEERYQEAGRVYRFFLGWRQATFAGYLAVLGAAAALLISKSNAENALTFLVPFGASLVGIVFWIIDKRSREIYHAAHRAAKKLENNESGYFSEVRVLPKDQSYWQLFWQFHQSSHSMAADLLFLGGSAAMFLISIIFLYSVFGNWVQIESQESNWVMVTILDVIEFGAPWVLVVMGAIVSLKPPIKDNRKVISIWIVMFAVVGGIVTVTKFWSKLRDQEMHRIELQTLRKELTGEDNYAYFQVRAPVTNCNRLFLSIVQVGFVRDVAIGWHKKDEKGKYIDLKTWDGSIYTFIGQTIDQNISISDGKYRIDFRSPNNNWEQFFEFSCGQIEISEKINVLRRGVSLLSTPIERRHKIKKVESGSE